MRPPFGRGEPMSIEAKLAAALAKYTTLCPLPAADVRAALGAMTELRTALQGLVDQIALTEPVSELCGKVGDGAGKGRRRISDGESRSHIHLRIDTPWKRTTLLPCASRATLSTH